MALSLDQVSKKANARKKANSANAASKKKTPQNDLTMSTKAQKNSSNTLKTPSKSSPISPAPAPSLDLPAELSPAQTSTRPQIRPWSQRGLAKEGRSPKERVGTNHHMNEEWMDLHEAPLFWMESSGESELAKLHEKIQKHLVEVEQFAIRFVQTPRELAAKAKTTLQTLVPIVFKASFHFPFKR